MSGKILSEPCSLDSRTKMDSDEYNENSFIIYIISPESNKVECYELSELYEWFTKQEKLYFYDVKKNESIKDRRIYKLAHTGRWVDQNTYDLIFRNKHQVLFLYLKEKDVPIGSSFGINQTHGTPYSIYSAIPMDPFVLKDINTLRITMKSIIASSTKGLNYEFILPIVSTVPELIVPENEDIISYDSYDDEPEDDQSNQGRIEEDIDRVSLNNSQMENSQIGNTLMEADETEFFQKVIYLDNKNINVQVLTASILIQKGYIRQIDLPYIKSIYIYNDNIDRVDFSGFPNVKSVTITNCKLKSTKGFSDLQYIDYLNLNYNDIEVITGLVHMDNLEVLYLMNNNIKSIENISQDNDLPGLLSLDLRYNQIHLIKTDIDNFISLLDIIVFPQNTNEKIIDNQTNTFIENISHNLERIDA